MTTTTTNLTSDFAKVLGCKPAFIHARLAALGHAATCGRCGGSGHYSYNPMNGTTCFGCNGAGKVALKLTADLLGAVKIDVAAGRLQPYLARLARKAKVKGYMDRFFAAWRANSSVAADAGKHWSRQSQRHSEINSFLAPMADKAGEACREVENGKRWDKATKAWVVLTDAEIDERLATLEEIMAKAKDAETLAPTE